MKIYIDSRAAGDYKFNTLVEIYVNGEVVKKGVLQKAEFCCVNLGDVLIEDFELKFFVITKAEGDKYNKLGKCALNKVPGVLEMDAFEDFRQYDAETDLTIEDTFNPKTWVYAYSTKITKLEKRPDNMVFVFNEEGVEGISICEVQGDGYNVSYERILSTNKINRSFKEWKLKWIKRGIVILIVSIILFILAGLLICSFNWSPASGKAQMSLLVLVALLTFVVPNGSNLMALKDILRIKNFLTNTEFLDAATFEKLKGKNVKNSKNEDA